MQCVAIRGFQTFAASRLSSVPLHSPSQFPLSKNIVLAQYQPMVQHSGQCARYSAMIAWLQAAIFRDPGAQTLHQHCGSPLANSQSSESRHEELKMEAMESFIKRETLSLFRKRLADPDLSDNARKLLLKLLAEEKVKEALQKEHEWKS
jgi:hypothetical protein